MTLPRPSLSMILRHVAALAVALLIVLTFAFGWWVGRLGAPEVATTAPTEPAAEEMYTCAMHPQIRLADADARCPICHMGLVRAGSVTAGASDEPVLVLSESAAARAGVRVAVVERRFPVVEVRLFGTIDFDETKVETIAARFAGRIERLFVDYTGVAVSEGDEIAELYSPELLVAGTALQEARRTAEALGGSELMRRAAEDTLRAARERLRLWELTDDQIATIEAADEPSERIRITARTGGTVVRRAAAPGDYLRTGDEIVTVAALDHLWVRLDAYESQLPWLRIGQTLRFSTDALPGTKFRGVISFIDPVLDSASRTAKVRLNVANLEGRLKPGMFVRAVVEARTAGSGLVIAEELRDKWISPMHPEIVKDGPGACDVCGMDLVPAEDLGFVTDTEGVEPPLVVPATAVLLTGRRAVVYVSRPATEEPTFEGRELELGPRTRDGYIVESGLREGEQVVVNGAFRLDSSLQIQARRSMMSVEGEVAPDPRDPAAQFAPALDAVFEAYFIGQEALAADDLDAFRQAARSLGDAVATVRAPSDDAVAARWSRISVGLTLAPDAIDALEDIEVARAAFEAMASAAIDLARAIGHDGSGPVYEAWCPMAFDDRGAGWLQRTEEIANPYFGDFMLRCGEVRAAIPARTPGARP